MLPDFITDKSKIAKYSYEDVEEIFWTTMRTS